MLKYLSDWSVTVGLILILPSSLPPSASEPDPEPPDVMEGQTKFIPLMEVCGGKEGRGDGGGWEVCGRRSGVKRKGEKES